MTTGQSTDDERMTDGPTSATNTYLAFKAGQHKYESNYRRALGGAHVPPKMAKIRKLGKFDAP